MLAGCRTAEQPARDLGADEIRAVVTTHTLQRCGREFLHRWVYTNVHQADGTMTARIDLSGDKPVAGTWRTEAPDLYCRTWSNHWGGGRPGCFRVAQEGPRLIFRHAGGSRGDADRYVYRIDGECP